MAIAVVVFVFVFATILDICAWINIWKEAKVRVTALKILDQIILPPEEQKRAGVRVARRQWQSFLVEPEPVRSNARRELEHKFGCKSDLWSTIQCSSRWRYC